MKVQYSSQISNNISKSEQITIKFDLQTSNIEINRIQQNDQCSIPSILGQSQTIDKQQNNENYSFQQQNNPFQPIRKQIDPHHTWIFNASQSSSNIIIKQLNRQQFQTNLKCFDGKQANFICINKKCKYEYKILCHDLYCICYKNHKQCYLDLCPIIPILKKIKTKIKKINKQLKPIIDKFKSKNQIKIQQLFKKIIQFNDNTLKEALKKLQKIVLKDQQKLFYEIFTQQKTQNIQFFDGQKLNKLCSNNSIQITTIDQIQIFLQKYTQKIQNYSQICLDTLEKTKIQINELLNKFIKIQQKKQNLMINNSRFDKDIFQNCEQLYNSKTINNLIDKRIFKQPYTITNQYSQLNFYPAFGDLARVLLQNPKTKQNQKDQQKAYDFAKKGTSFRMSNSQYILGYCYENGIRVNKDYQQAFKLYKKSAQKGNSYAQCRIGQYYQNLHGIKNYKIALQYYKKSAQQNNSTAIRNIGYLYQNYMGVKKDLNQAFNCYKKSAEQQNMNALFDVARFYQNGYGVVTQNIQLAILYYKKSSSKGNQDGKQKLNLLIKKS